MRSASGSALPSAASSPARSTASCAATACWRSFSSIAFSLGMLRKACFWALWEAASASARLDSSLGIGFRETVRQGAQGGQGDRGRLLQFEGSTWGSVT